MVRLSRIPQQYLLLKYVEEEVWVYEIVFIGILLISGKILEGISIFKVFLSLAKANYQDAVILNFKKENLVFPGLQKVFGREGKINNLKGILVGSGNYFISWNKIILVGRIIDRNKKVFGEIIFKVQVLIIHSIIRIHKLKKHFIADTGVDSFEEVNSSSLLDGVTKMDKKGQGNFYLDLVSVSNF